MIKAIETKTRVRPFLRSWFVVILFISRQLYQNDEKQQIEKTNARLTQNTTRVSVNGPTRPNRNNKDKTVTR
jgi:hypothetical protein